MSLPQARLLTVSAGAFAVLLGVSGCLGSGPDRPAGAVSAAPETTGHSAALTEAQARAALITEADLGVPWGPTGGAATWRDTLLKASTDAPACQQLLDGLYADELFGEPPGTYAVTALDDGDDQAQLRYQVATRRPADVDRTLAWLKTLPQTCAQFTAATTAVGRQDVQVTEIALPRFGDAREALRVTVKGLEDMTEDGAPVTLTLDVAAVRVGDDTIVLTDGALGTPPADVPRQALELGIRRLTQVRETGRAQA
ncbi:hypothetical protein [Streptomyces sp. NPDC046805]|uniref:hypothetical protein n=1 Tax=Streptomyces sp. NPDC046805 TaxID=3155134 RepID=UPI0034041405